MALKEFLLHDQFLNSCPRELATEEEDILLEDDAPVKDPPCSITQNEPTSVITETANQIFVGKIEQC